VKTDHYLLHVDATCGPYGLGECWSTIRSGLERMDGIVWVSDQANVTNKTGEFIVSPSRGVVTAKEVDALLKSHRITADVQGLELVDDARINGHTEIKQMTDVNLFLAVWTCFFLAVGTWAIGLTVHAAVRREWTSRQYVLMSTFAVGCCVLAALLESFRN
jgi:hypothetical protein